MSKTSSEIQKAFKTQSALAKKVEKEAQGSVVKPVDFLNMNQTMLDFDKKRLSLREDPKLHAKQRNQLGLDAGQVKEANFFSDHKHQSQDHVQATIDRQRQKQKYGIVTSGFNHTATGKGFYKVKSPLESVNQELQKTQVETVF